MGDSPAPPIPGGYVLWPRALREHPIWRRDPHFLRLWTYLHLEARWDRKPHQIGSVTIRRGQVLKSYRTIQEENPYWENQAVRKWSLSRIKRMLDWMEEKGMISTFGTDLGTLITIENFQATQDPSRYEVSHLGTDLGTPAEHLRNNRKKGKKGKNTPSPTLAREGSETESEGFHEFKNVYPDPVPDQSVSRWHGDHWKAAKRAYREALGRGVDTGSILEGTEHLREFVLDSGEFVVAPARWLEREGWKERPELTEAQRAQGSEDEEASAAHVRDFQRQWDESLKRARQEREGELREASSS